MDEETLSNMRGRAKTCRNIARTADPRTRKILEDMVAEIEADIQREEAEALRNDKQMPSGK